MHSFLYSPFHKYALFKFENKYDSFFINNTLIIFFFLLLYYSTNCAFKLVLNQSAYFYEIEEYIFFTFFSSDINNHLTSLSSKVINEC